MLGLVQEVLQDTDWSTTAAGCFQLTASRIDALLKLRHINSKVLQRHCTHDSMQWIQTRRPSVEWQLKVAAASVSTLLSGMRTSVWSHVANGCIAVLSPLTMANVLVLSGPLYNTWFLVTTKVVPSSRSPQLFLHSSPVCPKTHRHTDHTTGDICSDRPRLCIACRQRGLKMHNNNKNNVNLSYFSNNSN